MLHSNVRTADDLSEIQQVKRFSRDELLKRVIQ